MNKYAHNLVRSILTVVFLLGTTAHADILVCEIPTKSDVADVLGIPQLTEVLNLELPPCNGISLSAEGVGLRLNGTNFFVNGGVRSEVAVGFSFQEGDTVVYRWEMKFPKDFKADYPSNRWWLIGQWHDQPDPRIGESWATFPSRSPPVALYLEERSDDASLGMGGLGIGVILNGTAKRSWVKIKTGEWLKVTVTMRWSTQDNGALKFEMDGYPAFVDIKTKNMNNSYFHYLKLGQYRHPSILKDTTVYYRKLEVYKASSDVLPAAEK